MKERLRRVRSRLRERILYSLKLHFEPSLDYQLAAVEAEFTVTHDAADP